MPNKQHIDLSEVVVNHFARTHQLHPTVFQLSPDRLKELIDAVPDGSQLITELNNCLRRDGVCPVTR